MGLVTVYNAFSSADAHLIRSRLEAAGIPAVVNNELASLSMEGYSQATGGITVEVPQDQVEDARALIESGQTPAE